MILHNLSSQSIKTITTSKLLSLNSIYLWNDCSFIVWKEGDTNNASNIEHNGIYKEMTQLQTTIKSMITRLLWLLPNKDL